MRELRSRIIETEDRKLIKSFRRMEEALFFDRDFDAFMFWGTSLVNNNAMTHAELRELWR